MFDNQLIMNNQSNDSTPLTTDEQLLSDELYISVCVIIIFCSTVANLLLITLVYSKPHMRTSFNYLIVNMSVSDLFVPIFAIPLTISNHLHENRWLVGGGFGEVLCKLCYYLVELAPAVSVFSLVIIAANRFVAIVFPMYVNVFNRKITARLFIMVPWLVSMALCSFAFYTMRITHQSGYPQCISSFEPVFDNISAFRVYVLFSLSLYFGIPFLAIAVMYSIIMYKIHQSSENVSSMIQDSRSRKYRDRQIFYLSVLIIVAFGVLLGPVYVYNTYKMMALEPHPILDVTSFIMAWSNTVVNPLICILFNGKFRQGVRRLCCRLYWRNKRVTIQSRPTRTTKQSKDHDSSWKSISGDRFQIITAV